LESVAGKEPYTKIPFIQKRNHPLTAKTKVSGLYSNDEYVKFNEEIKRKN
jgi:hypothetical protein